MHQELGGLHPHAPLSHPRMQETESTGESSDEEASAAVIPSYLMQDDLPDSFVMTRLDVDLRQCGLSLVMYHQGTASMKPKSKLLLMISLNGKLELQLRRLSWGASLALQRFNVFEYLSATHKTDDHYRELISFNWQLRRHEAADVLKFCIDTQTLEKGSDPGLTQVTSTEEAVQRISVDIDCVAIKILVNWRCIKGLINAFAFLTSTAPTALTLPESAADSPSHLQDPEAKVVAPRRVIDWTIKMASPVIVLPQNHSDANSAALVMELGDVQFRRAVKVPAALVLDSAASKG